MKERKELNIQIGERIRKARETAGLTQERLSDMIDVSVQYISDLERGVVGTSVPTMIRLCDSLKVSSDYILMGRTEKPGDHSLKMPEEPVLEEENSLYSVLRRLRYLTPRQQAVVEKAVNLMIEAFSLGMD